MKASELRIGNCIQHGDRVIIVTPGDIEDIHDDPHNHGSTPIPLTEEWLLSMGFEEVYAGHRAQYVRYYTPVLVTRAFVLYTTSEYYTWTKGDAVVNIRYVHDLQNLYFVLTGEELEIK